MKKMLFTLIVVLFLLPGYLFADGMLFVDVESAGIEVKATTQRAILWQRNGVWEIHITPVFTRNHAKSAWVVPFPVLFKVKTGSSDFFNQLELLTAPLFVEACVETNAGSGCNRNQGGGDSNITPTGGQSLVEIWDQGTVGELDYVIISAQTQAHIIDWLKSNGYQVTDLAKASLRKFEADGTFFFAAKLSEDADPTKPVTPVRFILPELKEPVYPLVLTGLGVPTGASLELTTWVISDDYYVPTSHGYGTLPEDIETSEDYDNALRHFYLTHRAGTMVMPYHYSLAFDDRINKMVHIGLLFTPFSSIGIQAPEKWCAEIEEIVAAESWLARFQGRLGPVNMKTDLTFGPLPETAERVFPKNIYFKDTCEDSGPCGQ